MSVDETSWPDSSKAASSQQRWPMPCRQAAVHLALDAESGLMRKPASSTDM